MQTESKKSLQGRWESDRILKEIEAYEKKNEELEQVIGNVTFTHLRTTKRSRPGYPTKFVKLTEFENLQKELDKSSKFTRTRISNKSQSKTNTMKK